METLPSAKIVGKREGFAVPNSLSDFDNKAGQLVYRVTGDNGVLTDTTYVNVNILGDIYKTLFMSKVIADTVYTPLFDRYGNNFKTYEL